MDLREYQTRINRAIPDHDSLKDERMHWVIGLTEEVGEVSSVLKHHYYGGEVLKPEELVKEVGDVLWYLSMLCTSCGINIDKVAEINMKKLLHRFPDNDFDVERSKERHNLEQKFSETKEYRRLMKEAIEW